MAVAAESSRPERVNYAPIWGSKAQCGEVRKHDEHEFVQDLVVWLASDLVPIGHARISNSGGPFRQQQQPDGHTSAWTEGSSETVHGKVGAKS